MAFDRIVPITNEHVTPWTDFYIGRDETQIGRKNQISNLLLLKVVTLVDPLVHLNVVGRLVTGLEKAALEFLRPEIKINELLPTGARIGRYLPSTRMLLWIRRIGRVKRIRKDRMARHVSPPIIERDTPGIGARIAAERRQTLRVSSQTKPS